MYRWKVGDEGYEGLEYAELDIDALGHGIGHGVDDECDGGVGDGFECDEALQRAEGDGDHFGVFGGASHEHGTEEVV